MHRRVISVDIERPPVNTPLMEDDTPVHTGLEGLFHAAGKAAARLKKAVEKVKEHAHKAREEFKNGMNSVNYRDQMQTQQEMLSCLSEAEKHMESLERNLEGMNAYVGQPKPLYAEPMSAPLYSGYPGLCTPIQTFPTLNQYCRL